MASVCIFMLVTIFTGQVIAKTSRNCSNVELITNCDECFRCGGAWCMNPSKPRCNIDSTDGWCSNSIRPDDNDLDLANFIGIEKETDIKLKEEYENPEITIVNSTIEGFAGIETGVFDIRKDDNNMHHKKLYANAYKDFCPVSGKVTEYVTVKVRDPKWEDTKTEVITLTIPCACNCTREAETKSQLCNGRGTYSCNVCDCEDGWEGDRCEIEVRPNLEGCEYDGKHISTDGQHVSNDGRGDIGSCDNNEGVLCSNNGKCVNGRCICNQNLEGSQYFDSTCMDICQSTNYHDICLLRPPADGFCPDNDVYIMVDPLNTTLVAQRDRCNRKIWVDCTVTTDDCTIKYMAMKDAKGQTHVMIIEPCNAIQPYAQTAPLKVTVPVILGVLAVVATAAAVAGYMVWKNRAPPLPLNNPGYSNIDAEDCTGMNPLYKPPTSSFKNPTYGKW